MAQSFKYIYIMGPLTPRGIRSDAKNAAVEYLFNVRDMVNAAISLIKLGFIPFTPGLDFPYFLSIGRTITEEQMYGLSTAWLEKCDAIFALPGSYSDSSIGCRKEIERAKELHIPIFDSLSDLCERAFC